MSMEAPDLLLGLLKVWVPEAAKAHRLVDRALAEITVIAGGAEVYPARGTRVGSSGTVSEQIHVYEWRGLTQETARTCISRVVAAMKVSGEHQVLYSYSAEMAWLI